MLQEILSSLVQVTLIIRY